MAFILKQNAKDAWLEPKIEIIEKESIDELMSLLELYNQPKLILALSNMIVSLEAAKQDYKTSIFKSMYDTKYPYLFEFYSTDYTTKKSRVSYRPIEHLEKYGDILDKINPLAKTLKTFKLTEKEQIQYKKANNLLIKISKYLTKPSWRQKGVFQGQLEDDNIESKITHAESYALLFEEGYLDSNGYIDAHLSDAKLFSSIEVAKRSMSQRKGSATIVKLSTQLQEVILGHNENTDKITASIEKKRLEKMLELANIEELKKQIAEYEKNQPEVSNHIHNKKKIKI